MLLTKPDMEVINYFVSHPAMSKRAAYQAVRPGETQGPADKFWRRPEVQTECAARQKLVDLDRLPTPSRLIDRCMCLLEFNIGKFIRVQPGGGVVYDFTDATPDDWWAIQELKVQTLGKAVKPGAEPLEVTKLEFKTADRLKSLHLMKELLGLELLNGETKGGGATVSDVLKRLADSLPD